MLEKSGRKTILKDIIILHFYFWFIKIAKKITYNLYNVLYLHFIKIHIISYTTYIYIYINNLFITKCRIYCRRCIILQIGISFINIVFKISCFLFVMFVFAVFLFLRLFWVLQISNFEWLNKIHKKLIRNLQ